MMITQKYGLDMTLPEGKLPGFYAQIVKGIADKAPLFDRHKELLVFEEERFLPPVEQLLDHYKVSYAECQLLHISSGSENLKKGPLYEDYAIETRSGNVFADDSIVAAFRLHGKKPESEMAPALMQLEEHSIATIAADPNGASSGDDWHLIDRQLRQLAEKIAAAYRCEVEWLPA